MKALVISDVHSNIDALNTIWEKESDSDVVIFAGDMIDYGFFPCEVIQWFKSRKNLIAVRGNHDNALLKHWRNGVNPKPDGNGEITFWKYNMMRMSDDDFKFVESIPEEVRFELDGIHYFMSHRHDNVNGVKMSLVEYRSLNLFEEIWAEKCPDVPAEKGVKRRIIYGHYHQCSLQLITGDAMWMDPGSASYRKGPDTLIKGANYMIIKDGEVYPRYIDYPRAHLDKMVCDLPLTEHEKRHGHSFYADGFCG